VLLFQSILLASLASVTPVPPLLHASAGPAPIWTLRALALVPTQGLGEPVPAGDYSSFELKLPRRNDAFRSQGGFVRLDVARSGHLRVGPELSWSTPDSPREDLPKMRLLSPGWGVRFAWGASPVAFGVSACSRFVMVGKGLPVVDPLTSEARVEFRLP